MQFFRRSLAISILALPFMSHAAVVAIANSNENRPDPFNASRTGPDGQREAGHVNTSVSQPDSTVDTEIKATPHRVRVSIVNGHTSTLPAGTEAAVETGSQRTRDNLFRHH
jgi:hypothetical protein